MSTVQSDQLLRERSSKTMKDNTRLDENSRKAEKGITGLSGHINREKLLRATQMWPY